MALRRTLLTFLFLTAELPNVHGASTVHIYHDAVASTAAPSPSPAGVSDCFSPGATTADTASFRRLEATTTSSTPASPSRHPASRLTSDAHSCGPNTRAVARVTRNVCAGCASLPVRRPARIAVRGRTKRPRRVCVSKRSREGEGRRTVDDPALAFGRGYLQHRGNLRVWQVLPDVLKAKICEGQ
jgi:hypothetical protein